jgi:gliding motility-associated-like protein
MRSTNRVLAAFLLCSLMGAKAQAQLVCSIELRPDTTICQGETLLLTGPAGFPNYLWSTGETTQDITVGSTGNYTLAASYPTGEMAVNGNFTAGNTGFTTQFTLNNNLNAGDGVYWVGTNAASHHPQFIGTGNGRFLMVNAGWQEAGFEVWCQTHEVCPGQTYDLSFRAVSLATAGAPSLMWYLNGEPTLVQHQTVLPQNNWLTFNASWTVPAGVTTADFCIRVTSGHGVGNDIGIDDISISSTIVLTDEVEVTVTPLPVVDFGPDQNLCFGETLVLDATVPGGTYEWQDGSTDPTFTVSTDGTYTATVTANECTNSGSIAINYNSALVVDLGPDTTLCAGQTLLLDATLPGSTTYLWQDGSTSPTLSVDSPGPYSVTVTRSGCSATASINVGYIPLPVVDIGPDQVLCAGEQATFNATTLGASYLWQDGSTGATFTATTSGNVSVDVTVNGCTTTDAALVTFTPLPVVDLGPDQTVCPGAVVTLDATTPDGAYLWHDGSTDPTYSAAAPGPVSVSVTVAQCSASSSMTVAHYTLPVVDLGPDVTICAGASATFGVNIANSTYLWNTGAGTATIDPTTAGIYWVDVTRDGCTVRDSVELSVTPLPIVDLGTEPSVCPGAEAILDATTPGGTYLWNTGATTATINATPGDYDVQVTVNGCSASDAITVNAFPAAVVALGNDTTLCAGDALVLDVTQPGASHVWSTGATTGSISVSTGGTFSVVLTDANGCTATDAIAVDFVTPTPVDLGPDLLLCQGDEAILDATTPGASYQWSTGESTATITVGTSGTISVTVFQGSCSESASVDVEVLEIPVIDLGPDATLCPGESLTLDATTAGATYLWSTGSTDATIVVDQADTYSVSVTNAAGCTGSDAITVGVASPDAVDLGPAASICDGETLVLDATLAGATYLWSTGATTATITVNTTDTYWVTASQGSCSVSDTVEVTVQPSPQVDLGPDQSLCAGEVATLTAAWPGASIVWSTGETTASIVVNSTGNYSVELTIGGCTATDDVQITVLTTDAVDLGPDQTICSGAQAILDATTPGATYLWSTGATSTTISTNVAGTYWVQVSQASCSASDTVDVVVNDPGTIDLGGNLALCEGETLVLDATLAGATYLWDDGSTAPTRSASVSGTYSVEATVGQCTVSDAVDVVFTPLPIVDIGNDVELCPGAVASFDASTPGGSYLWHTGSTAATFQTSAAGTVSVTVTVSGCSAVASAAVSLVDGPQVDLGNDTLLCAGASLALDVSEPGASYLWDDGSNTASRTITDAGTYWVRVERNACLSSDTLVVDLFVPSSLDLGDDLSLCQGESATLATGINGAVHLWSTGATTPSIEVSTPGTYWVDVLVAGCSARDSVEIAVVTLIQPDLGDDRTICANETLVLSVVPGGASVLWSTGSTATSIPVTTSATYSVTVSQDGCSASDAVTIEVRDLVDALTLPAEMSLCPGRSLVLEVENIPDAAFVWSTGETGPRIVVSTPGSYSVEASGECISASATVIVVSGECEATIYVPNAFTPNSDGYNDVFMPLLQGPANDYRFAIFNRWGEELYATVERDEGWDGTYGGLPAQDGIYPWIIVYRERTLEGVQERKIFGHVTLLR